MIYVWRVVNIETNINTVVMSKGEFKENCDKCFKNKRSRIFPNKINKKWNWLCPTCWDAIDIENKNKHSL